MIHVPSIHAMRRRTLFTILALVGLLATLIVVRNPLGAKAEPISSTISANCSLSTLNLPLDVPITVDDEDPVTEGGTGTVNITPGLPAIPITVTINSAQITLPIPPEVASIDSVVFSGGNLTPSYTINGSNLVLTFTGPVSSTSISLPNITITGTIADGIAPTTIQWKTFSSVVSNTSLGTASCTPVDPNTIVNETTVEAKPATTTTAPTTTEPSSTTTEPPTTTTEPPTTTTQPPSTTTTAPSTTTTAPPPPPSGNPLLNLIKKVVKLVFCFLFRVC